MSEAVWHLIGDIGGTNARFGIVHGGAKGYQHVKTYQVRDYPDFGDVLNHLYRDVGKLDAARHPIGQICLAVAGPPHRDTVSFTNSSWQFTREQVLERTRAEAVLIINDFAATARALPALKADELIQIGSGRSAQGGTRVALGPGTGLGVAAVLPSESGKAMIISGEGGHIDFAPVTDVEADILRYLRARFGRVSIERLCCGEGIVNIYQALAHYREVAAVLNRPADIGEAARQGEPLSQETMAMFFAILGASAGNFALTFGALGGVYIAGGIAPRYIDLLRRSDFRARFLAKGRFADYLADIPTYVVLHSEIGLLGATLTLEDHL